MKKNNVEKIIKLTPSQEGILYQILSNEGRPKYSVQRLYKSKIPLNIEKCQSILDELCNLYSALRTVIVVDGVKQPVAVVLKEIKNKINFLTATSFEELSEFSKEQYFEKFDLQKSCPIRLSIIKLEELYYLCITSNHILIDGKSFDNIISTFEKKYYQKTINLNLLHDASNDYSSFLEHNREKHLEYWKENISEIESDYQLIDIFSEKSEDNKWLSKKIKLETEKQNELKRLSSKWNVTVNNILEYLWGITQAKSSMSKTICFARATSGREWGTDIINDEVGNFVNTIPVILNIQDDLTIEESLKLFNSRSLSDNDHQFCPFSDIMKYMPVNKLSSIVVNNNYSDGEENYFLDEVYEIEENEFPLHFIINNHENTIYISFNYDTNNYSETFINYLSEMFEGTLDKLLSSGTNEKNKKLFFENYLIEDVEDKKLCLPTETFEKLANKFSEKTAIVYGEDYFTYSQVLEGAKKIGHFIQNKYGEKLQNQTVILNIKKSTNLIMAMYGCWFAGAAYLILDPLTPSIRSSEIRKDLCAFCELTKEDLIDILSSEVLLESPLKKIKNDANDVAMYIYTSGTTGKPKGVKISFDNLANFITLNNENTIIKKSEIRNESMISLTSTSFDIFQNEIHVPLNNLGTIVIPDEEDIIKSIPYVSILQTTPSKFQYLFDTVEKKRMLQNIRLIILAGEKLPSTLINDIRKYTKADIINGYGPTECTIYSTFKRIKFSDKITDSKIVSIGMPYSNYRVSIERDGNNCLVGTVGEIVIYGKGVGLGYQNLESKSFLKTKKGYRTGDTGVLLSNGELRIIDRIDNQIKLNGYRIELEEIEYQIKQIPEILGCVAKLQNIDGYDYLSVYYKSEKELSKDFISSKINKKLMPYMLPNYYFRVDNIPTNINGKIDRNNLPALSLSSDYELGYENEKILKIVEETLNISNLSLTDNLMTRGLTSLTSIRLVGRINKIFDIDCSISDIFYNLRVSDLCRMINKKIHHDNEIMTYDDSNISEMPESQKRIFLSQQKYGDCRYNLPYICDYDNEISKEKLYRAINSICNHFIALKMNLVFENDQFKRIIKQNHNNRIFEVDEGNISSISDLIQPFNINEGEAFRIFIIKSLNNKWRLLFDFHHAFFDGVSIQNFFHVFSKVLNDEKYLDKLDEGASLFLPNIKKRYSITDEKYWKEKISLINPIDISKNYIISNMDKTKENYVLMEFPMELWNDLESYSVQMNTTPNIILMAVYAILLHKYSKNNSISFSFPISGRQNEDEQEQLDVFVKTLFINIQIENNEFCEILSRIKKDFYDSISHSTFIPDHKIDFVFANQPNDVGIKVGKEINKFFPLLNTESKFELSLLISEPKDKNGSVKIEYDTSLYDKEFIYYMIKHYFHLIKEIIDKPENGIDDLLLFDNEEKLIMNEFSSAHKTGTDNNILEKIADIAKENSSKVAMYFENKSITYDKLINKFSNLGNLLIDNYHLKKGERVGIYLDRGFDTIIAMLAILYAGGSYIPLSKEYPAERLSFIEKDSNLSLVLLNNIYEKNLFHSKTIIIDDIKLKQNKKYQPVKTTGDNTAYIIYTSGTTGTPKGVEITRDNLRNFCQDNRIVCRTKDLCEYVLFVNDFIFDITIQEIYLPLINGIPIIISKNTRETPVLTKYQNVGMFLTPSRLELMQEQTFSSISLIMMGGESFNISLYNRIQKINKNITFIHGYGPTEATVGCTYYEINDLTDFSKRIPIGKPIEGYEVRIVNDNLIDMGVGVVGEIVVSGRGIAKGYLNREQLNKEVFVERNGIRYYRTGDLGRWNSDGTIEFLGRSDKQVKINGYRIELSEIEQVLTNFPEVIQAKVVWNEEVSSLSAYLISEEDMNFFNIMKKLEKKLPKYMVPKRYAQIKELPIKETGKLDISQLPLPKLVFNNEIIVPIAENDKIFVDILSDSLNIPVDKISMDSNIFDIGAQSISVLKIIRKIEKVFGKHLLISEIFKAPTVKDISKMIANSDEIVKKIIKHEENNVAPMTDGQMRMYYLSQSINELVYNVPFLYSNDNPIESNTVFRAFKKVVYDHVEYRTAFKMNREGFYQQIVEDYQIDYEDLGNIFQSPRLFSKNLIQPFNLKLGNTIRLRIFYFENKQFIFLDSHHIVSDEQSMKIFWEEFVNNLLGEGNIRLNELTYLDYSKFIDNLDLSSDEEFWKEEMKKISQGLDNNTEKYDTETWESYEHIIKLDKMKLHQFGSNLTPSSYFQTLFAIVMHIYHLQEKITIGVPVSGRLVPGTDNIIGLFTNTLPIVFDFSQEDITFRDFIEGANEHFLNCLEHQLYPFNRIVDLAIRVPKKKENPLFNMFYSYHAKDSNFEKIEQKNLVLNSIPLQNTISKFDTSLTVYEESECYKFQFEFLKSSYDDKAIDTIMRYFKKIYKFVNRNEEVKLLEVINNVTKE